MSLVMTRRKLIMGAAGVLPALPLAGAARPPGLLIDTHIHLFAADQEHFPYHKNAPYHPPAADLEDYKPFVRQSKIDHAVIVHDVLRFTQERGGNRGIHGRRRPEQSVHCGVGCTVIRVHSSPSSNAASQASPR